MCGLRWMSLATDGALLAYDAAAVVGLRLMRLAALDARAASEAWLMVEEKWESAAQLQWRAMTGELGTKPLEVASASLTHLSRKVAANRRRLSKG
jgi:hypothetical protein